MVAKRAGYLQWKFYIRIPRKKIIDSLFHRRIPRFSFNKHLLVQLALGKLHPNAPINRFQTEVVRWLRRWDDFCYWVGEHVISKWEPMYHMIHILPETNSSHLKLGGVFKYCLFFIPKIGVSWSHLTKTTVFQLGWILQPEKHCWKTLVGRRSFPSCEGVWGSSWLFGAYPGAKTLWTKRGTWNHLWNLHFWVSKCEFWRL